MDDPRPSPPSRLLPALLLLYAFSLALFYVTRSAGMWTETDTHTITRTITAMQSEGTLVPAASVYQHGFLYQVTSVLFSDLSAFPPGVLQRLVYPFLGLLALVLSALFFYTRASGDLRQGALAALLLSFQPDVLFVILRGSHEKLDWPLMMAALALLYLSIGQPPRRLLASLLLFYLLVFALVATNVYFASTFLAAVLLGLLLGSLLNFVFTRRRLSPALTSNRLLYVALSSGILLYGFMAYLYSPALRNFRELRLILDQLSALFLGFEPAAQPYAYIAIGWISPRVYFGLSLFTWFLILASLLAWFSRGWRILTGREPFGLRHSLDWLLYAGFALQVGLSILVDFSGALSSNLQLRVFPGFTVLACLLLARALWRFSALFPPEPILPRRLAAGLVVLLCAWFTLAALFKASNEPLLSNKWSVFSPAELSALDWGLSRLQNAGLWVGIDERLRDAYTLTRGFAIPGSNRLLVATFQDSYPYVLLSAREQLRAARTGFTLPALYDWLRIYDNGEVQLYHRRPLTPFQK